MSYTTSRSVSNVSMASGCSYTIPTGGYSISISGATGAIGSMSSMGSIATGANGGYGGGYATGITTSVQPWNTVTWASTSINNSNECDITLKRAGKQDIKIGATLDLICELLNIVIPEEQLLENSPALKLSYEHYKSILQTTLGTPELKEAYDHYRIVEKLVREDKE